MDAPSSPKYLEPIILPRLSQMDFFDTKKVADILSKDKEPPSVHFPLSSEGLNSLKPPCIQSVSSPRVMKLPPISALDQKNEESKDIDGLQDSSATLVKEYNKRIDRDIQELIASCPPSKRRKQELEMSQKMMGLSGKLTSDLRSLFKKEHCWTKNRRKWFFCSAKGCTKSYNTQKDLQTHMEQSHS